MQNYYVKVGGYPDGKGFVHEREYTVTATNEATAIARGLRMFRAHGVARRRFSRFVVDCTRLGKTNEQ